MTIDYRAAAEELLARFRIQPNGEGRREPVQAAHGVTIQHLSNCIVVIHPMPEAAPPAATGPGA